MKVDEVLECFRDASKNEREKGDYFERLVTLFLKNDPELPHLLDPRSTSLGKMARDLESGFMYRNGECYLIRHGYKLALPV